MGLFLRVLRESERITKATRIHVLPGHVRRRRLKDTLLDILMRASVFFGRDVLSTNIPES
jgi:hypothetical protein